MNCYPIIESDDVVQVGDKIRIDVSKTFVARPDGISAIKKIEIKPTTDAAYLVIHDTSATVTTFAQKDWYLDWVYADKLIATVVTDVHHILVRVTLTDDSVFTSTKNITILTEVEDDLYSIDGDLFLHEWDIMKWLPDGKSSWKYMHRRAQSRILSYLDEKGFKTNDGSVLTKTNIKDKYDLKEWSTYMTLYLIFSTVLNSRGDIFTKKAEFYENKESRANNRVIRIDSDGDGVSESTADLTSPMLVRR
jgi:hypothetical protein